MLNLRAKGVFDQEAWDESEEPQISKVGNVVF